MQVTIHTHGAAHTKHETLRNGVDLCILCDSYSRIKPIVIHTLTVNLHFYHGGSVGIVYALETLMYRLCLQTSVKSHKQGFVVTEYDSFR